MEANVRGREDSSEGERKRGFGLVQVLSTRPPRGGSTGENHVGTVDARAFHSGRPREPGSSPVFPPSLLLPRRRPLRHHWRWQPFPETAGGRSASPGCQIHILLERREAGG